MVVLQVLAVAAGVLLVFAASGSAIKTVVLPRAEISFTTRAMFVLLRRLFDRIAPAKRSFAFRDRVMSYYAPIGLLLLPVMWIAFVLFGFTGLFWGTGIHPFTEAFATSGSSLFTLGFIRPPGTGRIVLSFIEAGFGLGVVSLMISYLPTIYGSFSRREAMVGQLEVRAGTPPSPQEMLSRYYRIDWLDQIEEELFPTWEAWFAELEESHTSQPSLVFFRSPQPDRSWITAAGCVLDTMAILRSSVVRPHDARADVLLRAGYVALRRIGDYFGIAYDARPGADDPISVTRAEFDEVLDELARVGLPIVPDRDQAWRDFSGWRVNYDAVLVALCALVMAPPAHWSSDRLTPGSPRPRPRVFRRRRAAPVR